MRGRRGRGSNSRGGSSRGGKPVPVHTKNSQSSSDSDGYYINREENKRTLRGVNASNQPSRGAVRSGAIIKDRASSSSDDGVRPQLRTSQPASVRGSGQPKVDYRDKYRSGPVRGGERAYLAQQQGRRSENMVLASSSDEEKKKYEDQLKAHKFNNMIDDQNRKIKETQDTIRYAKERSRSHQKQNFRDPNQHGKGHLGDQDEEAAENAYDEDVYRAEQRFYRDQEKGRISKNYEEYFEDVSGKTNPRDGQNTNRPRRNFYGDRSQYHDRQQLQDQSYSDYHNFEKGLPRESQQPIMDSTLMLEDDDTIQDVEAQLVGAFQNYNARQSPHSQPQQREKTPNRRNSPPAKTGSIFRGGDQGLNNQRKAADYQPTAAHGHYFEDRPQSQTRRNARDERYAAEKYSSSASDEDDRRNPQQKNLIEQNFEMYKNIKKVQRSPRSKNQQNNQNLVKRRMRNLDDQVIDERMRILTSMTDFVQPNKSGLNRVHMPKATGTLAHFEYQGRLILGHDKYIRSDADNNERKSQLLAAGEVLHFSGNAEEPQQRVLAAPQTDHYFEAERRLKDMYRNYYKSFDENLKNIVIYMESFGNGIEAQMLDYKEAHLAGPMQDFQASLEKQQEVIEHCINIFTERKFTSVAYYFDKNPEPDLRYLYLKEIHSTEVADQQMREKNIEKLEEMIGKIECDKTLYLVENLEDAKMSTDNYFDLKINNLQGIRECYLKLQSRKYQFTYQKFNNERQFVEQLPVYAKKKEFLDAFEKTQVIILQSSAGSGKSTQIPQYLLELDSGRTLVTEPRAIAVESVGNRVMAELASCWAPEGIVGYLCGPNFNVRSYTRVLYMTEHEFINQVIQDDSDFLDTFDTFLIDEAHELRKPQIVILAILKNHLFENPNKRLIVTSATLEANLFKDYFSELKPIFIEAKTPTYSVSTTYNLYPDLDSNISENTVAHIKAILEHIGKSHNLSLDKPMPNILVFLPTIPKIKMVQEKIMEDFEFQRIKETTNFQIEEFHGALTPQQKNEVLAPSSNMSNISRVILATNIAETAVTIPNIVYVLDSGLEREFHEDEVTCQTTERDVPISKSSAAQRQGRAGRNSNGYCFKMYSQEEFNTFEEAKKPELIRMDIADVVLQSIALSEFFEISDVIFYDKIESKVQKVLKLLQKLGCYVETDDEQKLTSKGEFIVKSSLAVKHAAFLYENLLMDNQKYGCIATAILSKTNGCFREREALQNIVDNYIHKTSVSFKSLGDLAPLLFLADEYDFKDSDMVYKFEQLKVKKQEMSMFLRDIDKIQREVNKLSEYVDDADLENPDYKNLKSEEKLQLAFMKCYPSNICVIADQSKQYPYYLLVESRELMKVHGSSIMARSSHKPVWMCCQNIVVSSITQREMTKVVVPIDEKMFRHFGIQDFIKARNITNQIVTKREVIEKVPTALLRFLRRKNKIEHFRKTFKANKVYLETEEEQEKVLYFYLTDPDDEQVDKQKVLKLHDEIADYSTTALKKRHALVKISERTKFQVDENCKIVDILSNSEYLGIIVKNSSTETQKILFETQQKLQIDDRDINIDVDQEKDICFVFLLNKNLAREYFEKLNSILSSKKPPIKCFEIKGGSEDFGSKFKKWKFILNWYEGTPMSDICLSFYRMKTRTKVIDMLKRFNQNLSTEKLEQQEEFNLLEYQQSVPYT